MNLLSKAAIIILGNVLVTFAIGLISRELLLNPALLEIEREGDVKDIHRFEQALTRYQQVLEKRISRILAAAAVMESLEEQVNWAPVLGHLSKIGGYDELDYFITSDQTGSNSTMQAGEFVTKYNSPPTPEAVHEILRHALQQIDGSNRFSMYGMTDTQHSGPVIYAIVKAQWQSEVLPEVFVLVRQINEPMIAEFAHSLGLGIELLDQATLLDILKRPGLQLAVRDRENAYYAVINGDNGQPVLPLRFLPPPRGFDDNFFSPTLTIALCFSLLSWIVVIALMYYTGIMPIKQMTRTMRQVRQSNNYKQKLEYNRRDELGKLVNECNELLKHVDEHTRELEFYSFKDPLTGLGNRRLLKDRGMQLWNIALRRQLSLSILVFDLDYFKQYNDIYGHIAGDQALTEFATILERSFNRDTDIIGRSGGEEFIVILLDTNEVNCLRLAEEVNATLAAKQILHRGSAISDHLTVSAGLACLVPNNEQTMEQVVADADAALYQAKRQGRDRCVVYAKKD